MDVNNNNNNPYSNKPRDFGRDRFIIAVDIIHKLLLQKSS